MPLRLAVGDLFPDFELEDHRGEKVSRDALIDGKPTVLAFFRGPW